MPRAWRVHELPAENLIRFVVVCLIGCSNSAPGQTPGSTAGSGEAAQTPNAGTQAGSTGTQPTPPAGSAGRTTPVSSNNVGGTSAGGSTSVAAAGAPAMPPQGGAGSPSPAAGSGGSSEMIAPPKPPDKWRMMGYDEKNWYFNPNETTISPQNAAQLTEKWRFKVSGFPIGTPVIAEGKVFAMAQGGIYAIDLETGKQLWSRTDIVGSAAVAYKDGFIYAHHSAVPPKVCKLKASDGKTVWGPVLNCPDERSCSGESSPIIVDNTVYVGMENNIAEASFSGADSNGKRGGVRALDAETGAMRWLYHTIPEANMTGENGASVWSTVSIDTASNTLFATTGNNFSVGGPNGDAFHAVDTPPITPRRGSTVNTVRLPAAKAALKKKQAYSSVLIIVA